MMNDIQSEWLKGKRRLTSKLLWLAPLITVGLVLGLMGGRFFMEGAYNWWYTMILPGTLALIVALTVSAEQKHNRHGLFSLVIHKEKLWFSQIIVNGLFLLFLNLIFFIVVTIFSILLGIPLAYKDLFLASLVLSLTFLWQIPCIMWLSEKIGAVVSIVLFLMANIAFGIFLAPSKLWWIPFAIPARLMCPIIKVLPNGLPMETTSPLADSSVIGIGLLVSLLLWMLLSIGTARWFINREVN